MSEARAEPSRGVPVFRFRGIQVVLDYTWFIIFALVVSSLGVYYFPQQYPQIETVQRWLLSVLAALLLFVSVLLHEFSHSLVAKSRGMEINRITLFLFGGVAQLRGEPPDARSELLIAVAGPVCSLVLGVGLMGASMALQGSVGPGLEAVLWYLGEVNLVLVAFNMVPGFPLDGGRILRAILWQRSDDLRSSTRVVSIIGQGFAFVLMGVGVLGLLSGLVVQGLFFVFIGMFLRQAADSGYEQVKLREGLSKVRVRDIMTADPVTVPAHISLADVVNEYFFRHQHSSFPVRSDGRLVGLVTINRIKQVQRDEWASTSVQAAMSEIGEVATLAPDDDAFDALMTMLEHDEGRMLVVEGGELVGIVSRKDILGFVQLRAELGG